MQKIEQRIERLEQRQTPADDTVTIFIVPLAANGQVPPPADGWDFTDSLNRSHRVMRLHGESDEQLQVRAMATARTAGAVHMPMFFQVTGNEGACHECHDIEQAA